MNKIIFIYIAFVCFYTSSSYSNPTPPALPQIQLPMLQNNFTTNNPDLNNAIQSLSTQLNQLIKNVISNAFSALPYFANIIPLPTNSTLISNLVNSKDILDLNKVLQNLTNQILQSIKNSTITSI